MALFDKMAASYEYYRSTDVGSLLFDLEKNNLYKLADPQEKQKALDLGCGIGIYAEWLSKMGLEVTGIDISQQMLARAKERAEENNLQIDYILGDLHELPFADNMFDLVISNIVIEFVENPQKVVNEVFRVLKKGGRFVCGFIGKESAWGKIYAMHGEVDKTSVFAHATLYSPSTASTLADILPEKMAFGSYFSPAEFISKEQALQLEHERAIEGNENLAGHFAVMWKKG